jgi:AraC-like DNA-binding protein
MKYLRDNFSDSEYNEIRWTPRFFIVYFILVLIAAAGYIINPRTDTWLIPTVVMAGMAYLVYCVIAHSTTAYINRLPDAPTVADKEKGKAAQMSDQQMKEICDKVMNYLTASGEYTNPDFSLSMLSVETGISPKYISGSINGHLAKPFFDLINEMRIEEAKKRLRALSDNHTIDSVGVDCGFRSRSTFFAAFKKAEGKTPTQWLKKVDS